MDIRCNPKVLEGKINAPSNKDSMYRTLICAALSEEPTKIHCNCITDEIKILIEYLNKICANIVIRGDVVTVTPKRNNDKIKIECKDDDIIIQMLLPVIFALFEDVEINVDGENINNNENGKLLSGKYEFEDNINPNYVNGLFLALPLLNGDSKIMLPHDHKLEKSVQMTMDMMHEFMVDVERINNIYIIKGNQTYITPDKVTVEGDWLKSSAFLCAGAISKKGVTVKGLNMDSLQNEKVIVDILKNMGAKVTIKGSSVTVKKDRLIGTVIDATHIPSLVPMVSVLASMCQIGATHIIENEFVRLNESNTIQNTNYILGKVGAASLESDDGLVIWGDNYLIGGVIPSSRDYKTVIASALISCDCNLPVDIEKAEIINSVYPNFFKDFNSLCGDAQVINSKK